MPCFCQSCRKNRKSLGSRLVFFGVCYCGADNTAQSNRNQYYLNIIFYLYHYIRRKYARLPAVCQPEPEVAAPYLILPLIPHGRKLFGVQAASVAICMAASAPSFPPMREWRPEGFRKGSLKKRSGSGVNTNALKPALQAEGNGAAGGGSGHIGHRVEVVAVGKVGDAEIDAYLFA